MAGIQTERSIEYVIDRIAKMNASIIAAHEELGIPLEDVLCAFVRKSLSRRASDDHQGDLFDDTRGTEPVDFEECT